MMKKILALLLALTCVFAVFSCGDNDNPGADEDKKVPTLQETVDSITGALGQGAGVTIQNVGKLFTSVSPTKIVAVFTETFGDSDIVNTTKKTLTIGTYNGYEAAVYEEVTTKLRSIEDGSGATILTPFEEVKTLKEYREDKGVRTNGGAWNPREMSFIDEMGILVMNITGELVTDYVSSGADKTVKFSVAKANTEAVFGQTMDSDVTVSITHDGTKITGTTITYTIPKDNKDHFDIPTSINIAYSYDVERITFN